MVVLETPVLIKGIAVGAIVQCGAFKADSFVKHVLNGLMETFDPLRGEIAGGAFGGNACMVQDFTGVKIPDPGGDGLVEQSNFDGPA